MVDLSGVLQKFLSNPTQAKEEVQEVLDLFGVPAIEVLTQVLECKAVDMFLSTIAKTTRVMYDKYIEAGFTRAEAMQLVVAGLGSLTRKASSK